MTTWGLANWENSQTTWDYRHNRDLIAPQLRAHSSVPRPVSMENRFVNIRRNGFDCSNEQGRKVFDMMNGSNMDRIEVNPSLNGYVTATIRRNALSSASKNDHSRYLQLK